MDKYTYDRIDKKIVSEARDLWNRIISKVEKETKYKLNMDEFKGFEKTMDGTPVDGNVYAECFGTFYNDKDEKHMLFVGFHLMLRKKQYITTITFAIVKEPSMKEKFSVQINAYDYKEKIDGIIAKINTFGDSKMNEKLVSIAEALKNLSVEELNEVKSKIALPSDFDGAVLNAKKLHKTVVDYIVKNMENAQIQWEYEDSDVEGSNKAIKDGDVLFTLQTKIEFASKSKKIITVITSIDYAKPDKEYPKSLTVNGMIFVQGKDFYKNMNKKDFEEVYDEQSFEQNKKEWVEELRRICK